MKILGIHTGHDSSAALIVDIALRQRIFHRKGLWFFLDPPSYGAFLSNLSHRHAPAGKQLATFVCPCSPQEAGRPEVIQTLERKIEENLRLVVDAPDATAARRQVEEMCNRILANPVIEEWTVRRVS